ncbi:unnamed protein product [Blumeria hordei]|uniref:1-acyl-sn-glycerol-3-phosphate acyltransferase n=1 Tax=Blumeria hordei TaxID=2867405 RepID=A0A383V1Z8_BLUHO|nr:unnamed protein product [Blumeria hordei]
MSSLFDQLGLGLVIYVVLTLSLYTLSLLIPVAGFGARLLAAYASLLVCASAGVVSSACLHIVGYPRISQWFVARCFKHLMWYTTGLTFIVDDPHDYLNQTRPAIFIGNHQTELDVLMLACIFPKWCSVTAKRSLLKVPFLGWFMRLSGTVFIDRTNPHNARQAMAGAATEIQRHRQSVYMFPEGTRSYARDPILLPFKKGAFHLAVQAQVPLVPVVVANYSHLLDPSALIFRAGRIPIKGSAPLVLPPIETKNLTTADVDALTRQTHELMRIELESLTCKARGLPMPMSSPQSDDRELVMAISGTNASR